MLLSIVFKIFQDQEKLPEPLQFLPPTKQRESDPTIRLTHVETLLLLCHTRWGRDYQRQHGVYEIIRAAHENETVDKVLRRASLGSSWGSNTPFFFFQISEHIERLVQLLHGDEPKITNADDELEELNSVPETQMDVTKGSTAKPTEDDDEDFRIEEI